MKIKYDSDPWGDRSLKWMAKGETPLEVIDIANDILDNHEAQGFTLILRQLFYQFVKGGLFNGELYAEPGEGQKIYKNFGALITKARNNGLMSWNAIEDRGRNLYGLFRHEENDQEVVTGLEDLLSIDKWKRQETYVEVWVEKESLSQVIARACDRLDTPYMACKGYLSASEAWRAGQRFEAKRNAGKKVVMIHLGDHDPEGIDMTRDNGDRLFKYSNFGQVDVIRIALNMDQIEEHNPPPNYAKASSSRFDSYVSEYGEECWELDALEPSVIVDLIDREIKKFIDFDVWKKCQEEEADKRHYLEILHDHWDGVKDFLDEQE